MTTNLPTLMSRDADEVGWFVLMFVSQYDFKILTKLSLFTFQALPVLYPSLLKVIGVLTFSQLIGVLRDLTSSESLTTYESLSLACQNKVCALCCCMAFYCWKIFFFLKDFFPFSVWTFFTVWSPVPRREVAVLWCSSRAQHR